MLDKIEAIILQKVGDKAIRDEIPVPCVVIFGSRNKWVITLTEKEIKKVEKYLGKYFKGDFR